MAGQFQRLPFDRAGLLVVHDDVATLHQEARLAVIVQDRYARLLVTSVDIVVELDLEGTLMAAEGASC